ncbi:hypothetical protein BU16DRAFT_532520 [Lophium mytilinum]|uniref:Uncharacterized protein n=1 Tax=Lophium mytilinum TaxID=390894 RepID=A0A6A6RBM8_9PEZI|nr:hypothetical protein BU16DRAFT_532520 [Lophium mytilinum]
MCIYSVADDTACRRCLAERSARPRSSTPPPSKLKPVVLRYHRAMNNGYSSQGLQGLGSIRTMGEDMLSSQSMEPYIRGATLPVGAAAWESQNQPELPSPRPQNTTLGMRCHLPTTQETWFRFPPFHLDCQLTPEDELPGPASTARTASNSGEPTNPAALPPSLPSTMKLLASADTLQRVAYLIDISCLAVFLLRANRNYERRASTT